MSFGATSYEQHGPDAFPENATKRHELAVALDTKPSALFTVAERVV